MLCTKCGHDNPPSAKFCNECGAITIERRKGERRQGDRRQGSRSASRQGLTSRGPVPVPSLTPGEENAQGHSPARQAAGAYLRKDRPIRGPEEVSHGEVSGPSFLGLAGGSSGSADYLLEDETHSGRKWAVLLVIVVIAVLFYLQFRPYWHGQPAPPPPATSQPPETAPQGKAAPASEATGVPTAAAPQQAVKAPDPSASPPGAAKDAAAAAADTPSKSDDTSAADSKKDDAASGPDSGGTQDQAPAQPAHKPIAQPRKPAADHSSAAVDAQRDPMLFMAQKYLYGQGVPRNCDQAMVYLRAANQRANAPARSQMGALYATGHCVPLDRVRAYQWFTSALNLEPGNADLQHERNNLWAQMSSDERQQAVK